jgi:hypothetical protein
MKTNRKKRRKSRKGGDKNKAGNNPIYIKFYRAIGFVLDSIHRLVCGRQKTTTFRRMDLSPSSGGWGKMNLLSWAR